MWRIAALVAIFFVHAASAQPLVIHIDDDHMQIGDHATTKLFYAIPSTKEIDIDFTGYIFSLWPADEPPPNAISVIVAKDQQYNVTIEPGITQYRLTAKTLEPRSGSTLFGGFLAGQQIILAIGRRTIDPVKMEDKLRVHWMGLINIE